MEEEKKIIQEGKEKHCCCHHETPRVESCCSGESHREPMQATSCCHEHHEVREDGDCCCHREKHVESSCCHEHHEAETGSCCCGEHHKHHAGCDCCGEKETKGYGKLIRLIVSLAALIVSFIDLHARTGVTFFMYVDFAWIAVILCGYSIFRSAVTSLAKRKVTSSVLISTAILASIALEFVRLFAPEFISGEAHESYVFAAGEVAFLMTLGGWIEDLTVARSRRGIEQMMSLAPATAERIAGEETEIVPAEEIEVGDLVLVRPGSVISVDGEVEVGTSAVDESAITGESVPVEKEPGSAVYGGTMNKNGMLRVRVTKRREDMWVSKVAELMEEAEGRRAPIARLADKWASYIVPSAVVLAVLIFGICALIPSVSIPDAIIRGVTVLVVFCPCALGLATPTAVAAGIGALAKEGVMVKNGGALEAFAKVSYLCLDKTGTVTKGELAIENVCPVGVTKEELMRVAASAESASEHPIARAIVAAYQGELAPVSDMQALVGVGIRAVIDGVTVEVCSYEAARGRLGETESLAEAEAALGRTVVCVFREENALGVIALADTVREDAAQMVEEVKALGVTPVMLTGDHRLTAAKVSREVGIEEYRDSLRPEDKSAAIEEYKKVGVTAMVGDGVNDAPALVSANCSASIASIGSEIAVESSDVALLDGKIEKVPRLIAFSRRVLATIKGNIIFAMCVNVAAVTLSAFGILSPVTGAIMHNGTSILVVLHSALLLTLGRRVLKRPVQTARRG